MKITRLFAPITIVLETEQELSYFKDACVTLQNKRRDMIIATGKYISWRDELPMANEQWASNILKLLP